MSFPGTLAIRSRVLEGQEDHRRRSGANPGTPGIDATHNEPESLNPSSKADQFFYKMGRKLEKDRIWRMIELEDE